MIRIRFLRNVPGFNNPQVYYVPGQEKDVPADVAARLVADGAAELVNPAAPSAEQLFEAAAADLTPEAMLEVADAMGLLPEPTETEKVVAAVETITDPVITYAAQYGERPDDGDEGEQEQPADLPPAQAKPVKKPRTNKKAAKK